MRKITISFLLLVLLSLITIAWLSFSETERNITTFHSSVATINVKESSKELLNLKLRAIEVKAFVKQKRFDTSICFLIDMSLAANQNRFFVYDLSKDAIQISGLVAHGNCNQYWLEGRKYGNEIGCGCTSLGKYRIGNSYYGRFGLSFKLYGLDKTNSNAFNRYVVLHAHDCMPDHQVEDEVCQSNGCPMVSPNFLKQLKPMIRNAKQPVLLWIFE